ncbi:unnamed protein product [Acanthoscelides obtectus]|uniref:HTH psq-type domain-containing protein n=1 Tax=Acanthoscelides obtectus TaxID=200917 RepID=A0A9P0K757_ACAOB|nr:unnamed protein product [Acanthoscelides obtectus]CAK1633149.1 hypothetical protein AOBTE_LOCUS7969 [Acanthoscelides obtectus]
MQTTRRGKEGITLQSSLKEMKRQKATVPCCTRRMETKKQGSWSPRKMKSAIRDIRGGAKLKPTAALYGIPVMTLSDYSKRGSYDMNKTDGI